MIDSPRVIMGVQPVREAIRVHGERLARVLVERDGGPTLDAIARFANDRGIEVERTPRAELDRRAQGGRHQGVIAFAPDLEIVQASEIPIDASTCLAVLDGVVDPQNFGAVIRSAVALGASAVIWAEHGSAPLTPATFRASAGAIEHARLCRVPALPEVLAMFAERGVTSIALDASGDVELSAIDLTGPVAIVIGAEDKGVRRGVRRACRHAARLPMRGPIASLNASVAGAIAFYEVNRQRSRAPR